MPLAKDNERVKKDKEGPELGSFKNRNQVLILQTQDLKVGQVNKPYIGLIHENLIKFQVQSIYLIYYARYVLLILKTICKL